MVLALPVLAIAPEFAPAALRGRPRRRRVLPDLDLYAGHRKTLHYPVYASLATVPTVALAVVAPSTMTVALAVALSASALHAVADVLGGGLELRPWEEVPSERFTVTITTAGFDPAASCATTAHPKTLTVAGLVAVPLVVMSDGPVTVVTVALLSVSAVYVLLRKTLANIAERLAGLAPDPVAPYLPERYRQT